VNQQPSASLRPRQAADFLGIGESTFWRWAKEREDFPKPIRLGPRTTVFPLDKLTAWRDAQATKVA
jgi:prophage regulatory protein